MNIDYSKTLSAFNAYEGKMDFLTMHVHQFMLSEDGLGKPGWAKQLIKGVSKIADSNKELLLPSFIGKVRYKVPALRLSKEVGKLSYYDQARAKIIAAAITTNVLLDNGTFAIREDIKRIDMASGERKFKKFLYIQLGGKMEKDLYDGIHLEAGVVTTRSTNGWSLPQMGYEFLSEVASVPLKIWNGASEEMLLKSLELSPDWTRKVDKKGNKLSEDPIAKRKRKKIYVDKIINHVKRFPKFYLSGKFCDRNRFYYDQARLEGMRPHGKGPEVMMIDSADGYIPGEDDAEVLRHIIYVHLHGKASVEVANKKFKDADLATAKSADPMKANTHKEFERSLMLNKAAACYQAFIDGERSHSLFGQDFTNSGLMMAGISFRSKEMMKAGNLGGHKTVYDSHTEFGKGYGLDLDRDTVKEIHTPLLHGSTAKTMAKILNDHLGEVAVDEHGVREANERAYGDCVRNIESIADWGTMVTGNRQDIVRWTMPDDWKAAHRAHMDGVPVRVYASSARHKELYNSYIVTASMPLCEDKNGIPIFNRDTVMDGVHYKVKVSKRGLYANITHSIDAFVMRCVVRALVNAGEPFLLKHDDYIVRPGARSIVLKAAQEAFDVLYERNVYQEALEEIADHSPYDPLVPQLVVGNARNTASVSTNFIMP